METDARKVGRIALRTAEVVGSKWPISARPAVEERWKSDTGMEDHLNIDGKTAEWVLEIKTAEKARGKRLGAQ